MRVKPKAARQPHEATASGMSASDPEHQSIHEAADGYKAACVTMPVWTGQALAHLRDALEGASGRRLHSTRYD